MAKPRRSDVPPHDRKPLPEAPPFANPRVFPPDPPRQHLSFLILSASAVALWLSFLLWMAIKAHR